MDSVHEIRERWVIPAAFPDEELQEVDASALPALNQARLDVATLLALLVAYDRSMPRVVRVIARETIRKIEDSSGLRFHWPALDDEDEE